MQSISDRIRDAGEQLSNAGPGSIPLWLMTSGITAWLVIGVAGVVALAAWLFVTSASISIPLVLAAVIGMVAYPLCEKLRARGLGKSAAAGVVLVLLFAILAAAVWITVAGIISQWPAIKAQLEAGWVELGEQLAALGWDVAAIQGRIETELASGDAIGETAASGGLLSSVLGAVTSRLSGVFEALFGLFIGTTLLYYVLADFPTMTTWVANHMGRLPKGVGAGIVDDAVSAMRGYFRATTITGLVVSATIAVAMVILGIPLAVTVALVTFLTCYIPYFGAIISGAFAFIVALGTAGMPAAIVLLAVVLIAQNVLQTVINAKVMGESLNLHPLVVLVVTMLGGIFGGLLGAALGAPVAALLINAGKRLQAAFEPEAATPAESPS